jgi:transposase
MNAYSKDLRLRVLEAVDRGVPRKEVANLFGVPLSTIKRYIKRPRAGQDLESPDDPQDASDASWLAPRRSTSCGSSSKTTMRLP